jgi:hypothetical protein
VSYHTGLPEQADIEGAGMKKDRRREEKKWKSRRRSLLYITESAVINYRQKLEKDGIDNEDKELIDKGNNVRYLRMNWIDYMTKSNQESHVTEEAEERWLETERNNTVCQ